jgi:hypothetical protein
MFSKRSRYAKLDDTSAADAQGREIAEKSLRPMPEVNGTFLHTVEEGDRLDHLGFTYYKDSTRWWRICDANPEWMSPQAMLGKEPMTTVRIPVTVPKGESPPWSALGAALAARVGIETALIVDELREVEREVQENGRTHAYTGERDAMAIIVTFNRMNIGLKDIVHIVNKTGFSAGDPGGIGRTGKKIVIPPLQD